MYSVRYIENSKINRKKWDLCIKEAINIDLVAFSWFLDSVCEDWDALVFDDYKAVMPLPFVRQGRFELLKQPILTKYLGVYSVELFTEKLVNSFLEAIPPKFKRCSLGLGPFTPLEMPLVDYSKNVYELDLVTDFKLIKQGFSPEATRRVEHAKKAGLVVEHELPAKYFVEILKHYPHNNSKTYTESELRKISSVISSALRYGLGEVVAIYTPKKKLCAAGFFLSYINQSALMLCSITNSGKDRRADYLMIYEYIKKKSFKPETLSFYLDNYSRHDKIADYFGAQPVVFGKYRRNTMSLWQRVVARF